METRIKFILSDDIITNSDGYSNEEIAKLENSVREKTSKVIKLNHTIIKGMKINLNDFVKIFEYSKEEIDYIRSANNYYISDIFITPEYLEVHLGTVFNK